MDVCSACQQPCPNFIDVGGKIFHQDCLKCTVCQEVLTGKIFPVDGKFYCERDVASLRTCTRCGKGILHGCVTAMDNSNFHAECFACVYCSKPIDGEYIVRQDPTHGAVLVCKDCAAAHPLHAPQMCSGCNQQIVGKCFRALGGKWHPPCFKCAKCGIELAGKEFAEHDGRALCPQDSLLEQGLACEKCGKALDRAFVVAKGKRFHSECLRCYLCTQPFEAGAVYDAFTEGYAHLTCVPCSQCGTKLTNASTVRFRSAGSTAASNVLCGSCH